MGMKVYIFLRLSRNVKLKVVASLWGPHCLGTVIRKDALTTTKAHLGLDFREVRCLQFTAGILSIHVFCRWALCRGDSISCCEAAWG